MIFLYKNPKSIDMKPKCFCYKQKCFLEEEKLILISICHGILYRCNLRFVDCIAGIHDSASGKVMMTFTRQIFASCHFSRRRCLLKSFCAYKFSEPRNIQRIVQTQRRNLCHLCHSFDAFQLQNLQFDLRLSFLNLPLSSVFL